MNFKRVSQPDVLFITDRASPSDQHGIFPCDDEVSKLLRYTTKFLGITRWSAIPAAPLWGKITAHDYREHEDWLLELIREFNPKAIVLMGKGATYTLSKYFPERYRKAKRWNKLVGRPFAGYGDIPTIVTVSPSELFADKNKDGKGYMQLRTVVEHTHRVLNPATHPQARDYRLVTTKEELKAWLTSVPLSSTIGIDLETTGLNFQTDQIKTIQFSHQDYQGITVLWETLTVSQWESTFQWLSTKGCVFCGANFKFDSKFLIQAGVTPPTWNELFVQHVIVDSREGTHNLDWISWQTLGEGKDDVDETSFLMGNVEEYATYAAKDADLTRRAAIQLHTSTTTRAFQILRDASYTLAQAEHFGIRVDQDLLEELYSQALDGEKEYSDVFARYDVRSANDRIGIQRALGITGSTDKQVLEELAGESELARSVIDARGLAKVRATYLDRIRANIQFDGRYHPDFRVAGPSTGRTSCGSGKVDPGQEWQSINLQNIPRPGQAGEEFHYKSQALRSQLRNLFVADEGCVLLGADLEAAEMRVAAAECQDELFVSDMNGMVDTHSILAILAYDLPIDITQHDPVTIKKMVKAQYDFQRTAIKKGTFGTLYGATPSTIATQVGCSVEMGRKIQEAIFSRYPGLEQWRDRVHWEIKKTSRTVSWYGRERIFPYGTGVFGHQQREAMLREGQNFKIQSTASDYALLAMSNFDRKYREKGWRVINFVHDACYTQVPERDQEEAMKCLKWEMENADDLKGVRMYSEVHAGQRWGEL